MRTVLLGADSEQDSLACKRELRVNSEVVTGESIYARTTHHVAESR
jgi:hypothetical protein